MCDYDWSYEEISRKTVTTRKKHQCGSCLECYPAGTTMIVAVGLTDGDLGRTYACPACTFALAQDDGSPLHLCWGWNWNGDNENDETATHEYLDAELKAGRTPTAEGRQLHLSRLQSSLE